MTSMPPRPRRAAITPLAALAVGAGIATVLLHAAAVGTSAGQRLDDAGRRIPPSGDLSPADAATLRANDFNLSAGRYRPMSQTAIEHLDPRELLDELAAIEVEIAEEVEALRAALAEQTT